MTKEIRIPNDEQAGKERVLVLGHSDFFRHLL